MVARALWVLAVGVAAAVVWLAAGGLAWPARGFTAVLLAVLPPLAVVQLEAVGEVAAHRIALYLSSAGFLWVLATLAVGAGLASGFSVETLGLYSLPSLPLLAWSLATLLSLGAVVAAGRALGLQESRILACLLPRTGREKLGFVALCLSAGICEEVIFRGFLIPALGVATGSTWLAAFLSAGAFGVLHAYQRAMGMARACVLGLLLTIPFLASGSLIPSMIAHAALDLIAGLWLADRALGRPQ